MGLVTRGEWADVMMKVTGIKIRWLAIMKSLVPADALTPRTVDYIDFLASFTIEVRICIYVCMENYLFVPTFVVCIYVRTFISINVYKHTFILTHIRSFLSIRRN